MAATWPVLVSAHGSSVTTAVVACWVCSSISSAVRGTATSALSRSASHGRRDLSDTDLVPELIVIVGPIASGKSTVAHGLGCRFRAAGRPVAVLDLDDVVDTIGGFAGLTPGQFRQAQLVHGELVGAWLRRSFDVIAHGPFFEPEEDRAVLHAVPAGIVPRRVQLLATYEAALARTALDRGRAASKDPGFLRAAYDRAGSLLPGLPPAAWSFDTTTRSSGEIVDALAADLLP